MINVPIDRIVPLTDARDNFSRIVADIENQSDGMYVLTKGGKPAIALINIDYLGKLMAGHRGPNPAKPKFIGQPQSEPKVTVAASPTPSPAWLSTDKPKTDDLLEKEEPKKPDTAMPSISLSEPIVKPAAPTPPAPPKPMTPPSSPIFRPTFETKPEQPKPTPPVEPAAPTPTTPPSTPTTPSNPSIDPSWTGKAKEEAPASKPSNPWPILPPKEPVQTNNENKPVPTSASSNQPAAPASLEPPPKPNVVPINQAPNAPAVTSPAVQPPSLPISAPEKPVAPAPVVNGNPGVALPTLPPKPPVAPEPASPVPSTPPSAAKDSAASLPPPPPNPSSIHFDEPPKINSDPEDPVAAGQKTPSPTDSVKVPINVTTNNPVPSAPKPDSAPATPVKDLDI